MWLFVILYLVFCCCFIHRFFCVCCCVFLTIKSSSNRRMSMSHRRCLSRVLRTDNIQFVRSYSCAFAWNNLHLNLFSFFRAHASKYFVIFSVFFFIFSKRSRSFAKRDDIKRNFTHQTQTRTHTRQRRSSFFSSSVLCWKKWNKRREKQKKK